jgi:hypothetical protein
MLRSDVLVHAVDNVIFADGTLVVKTFLLRHSMLVKQSITGKLLLAVGTLMYHICSLFQMPLEIFFRTKLCLAGVAFVCGWLLKRLRWVRLVPMAIEKGFSAIETIAPLAGKLLVQVNRPDVVGCIVLCGESFLAKVAGDSRGVDLLVGGQVVFGGVRF